MAESRRRSKYWRVYGAANKGDCPKEGIPFWQLINPFTFGLDEEDKYLLSEEIRYDNIVRKCIKISPTGLEYISFGTSRVLPCHVASFRSYIFQIIPEPARKTIPQPTQIKYSRKHNPHEEADISRAVNLAMTSR